jgi:hypothetical protein
MKRKVIYITEHQWWFLSDRRDMGEIICVHMFFNLLEDMKHGEETIGEVDRCINAKVKVAKGLRDKLTAYMTLYAGGFRIFTPLPKEFLTQFENNDAIKSDIAIYKRYFK